MCYLRKVTKFLPLFLLLTLFVQPHLPVTAAGNHDELFVLIGDSLMKVKDGDQEAISRNMEQFARDWKAIKQTDSKQAKRVSLELKNIQILLADQSKDIEAISKGLSSLSSAVVLYDQEQNPPDKAKGKEQVRQILPLINNLKTSVETEKYSAIQAQYQAMLNQWNAAEKAVHDESIAAYGNIEKEMALIRIAITQEPADWGKAKVNLDQLTGEVDDFLAGKITKSVNETHSLSEISTLLTKVAEQISEKDYQNASEQLNQALTIWPMVEGDVQTRDSKLYSDIETKIPTVISILESKTVKAEKATAIVKDLHSRLAPLLSKTNYTMWDAALILLREGLEALLIVATLLAFLKKMGQTSMQKWIWVGVAAGIVASAALAIVINLVFSQIVAASSREYIEGLTGVIAVAMMLIIGAWLHNKSSIGNWNQYIHQQIQQAIAKGSLISFAVISFLSVFREGAETIIFYAGITPYISFMQLLTGVILAIAILAIIGFAIIKYSVRIPIRFFFKTATILIYFLAFKILGISIHALQISKVVSTTTEIKLPFIDWLGLYPTWETTATQVLLLVVIILFTYWVKKRDSKQIIITNV
ncbi:FTR1 family iron permease [Neobacillus jeddahensis]|uniref:FTR1 family iron permease n=1 Tax=Neobacillus jeddahensis TaxID=1461580 RepID=UPI00058EA1AE|nr:FTR1 family protein [Neobacillus jeddahensis]